MTWKLLWQFLFISGFIVFIGMFFVFSYRGYHELISLLKVRDIENTTKTKTKK